MDVKISKRVTTIETLVLDEEALVQMIKDKFGAYEVTFNAWDLEAVLKRETTEFLED